MKEKDFESFKKVCIDILAQSDNCMESQVQFRAATSIHELVLAWQRFWAGVLREVPEQVIAAFTELYDVYGSEINKTGMYFNEAPKDCSGTTILVGDCDNTIDVYGRARVYVIGKAVVNAHDNVLVQCNTDKATINLYDYSKAIMDKGNCNAYNRSTANGRGVFSSHDSSTVYIAGGVLEDYGHLNIIAYNDAIINSFTSKKIELKDKSILNIRK